MIRRKFGMITVRTRRVGVPMPLFPDLDGDSDADAADEADDCELVWHESELTGMEGATTKIGFALDSPDLVSMLRGGSVNTALIFEAGRRHICIYNTPFSAFEVCVQALRVDNRVLTDGSLLLDYLIEIRGNRTERCRMEVSFIER